MVLESPVKTERIEVQATDQCREQRDTEQQRLRCEYERWCATTETWIYLAKFRLILPRLARLQ
jgi:hypothetical protein